ncbi:MAG: acyl-CoA dehydrogenase family protein, partial [Nocardioidaceae bacterium]
MTPSPDGADASSLDGVRRFVLEEAEASWDEVRTTDDVPDHLVARLATLGLTRLTIPTESGGCGLSTPDYQPYLELAAQGPGWVRMLTHVGNGFWRPVAQFGSPAQQAMVPQMAQGETFLAFALTERAGGTGRDLHSRAVRDGTRWQISGEKHLITFADRADYFLL